MNKKIAAIIAGSVAALGSAIVAAPAHAQTATLPVTVTVRPAVFLRTYSDLKFVVSQQDLQGGGSVEQALSYDETSAGGPQGLSTTAPTGQATNTVVKTIPQLYQVWGGRASTTVAVNASQGTLTSSTSGTLGGSADTVTMTVSEGASATATTPVGKTFYPGAAKLSFQFSNPATAAGTVYTGGQLTISVTNP